MSDAAFAVPLPEPDDLLAQALQAADGPAALERIMSGGPSTPALVPLARDGPVDPDLVDAFGLDLARMAPAATLTDEPPLSPPAPPSASTAIPAGLFDVLQKDPTPTIGELSTFGLDPSRRATDAITLRAQIRKMLRNV